MRRRHGGCGASLHGVADAAAALGGDHQQAVADRLAQLGGNGRQPQPHAVQATHAAGVAVGVVAGGGGDGHRPAEVVAAEQQRDQHHRVVGQNRAGAGKHAVAVARIEPGPHLPPVALAAADGAHVVQQAAKLIAARERLGGIQKLRQRPVLEGQRLQGAQVGGAVERHAVVAHRRRRADQRAGLLRVAGRHQRQRIGEDLGADLGGEHRSVERAAAAVRGPVAHLEAQVRGVLGGATETAPPQDRLVLDDGVEPSVAEIRRRDAARVAAVLQRPEEAEAAGQVVVGHHQRQPQRLVHIAVHLTEPLPDRVVRPTLHRPPQVHTNHLAQHAGIGCRGEFAPLSRHIVHSAAALSAAGPGAAPA